MGCSGTRLGRCLALALAAAPLAGSAVAFRRAAAQGAPEREAPAGETSRAADREALETSLRAADDLLRAARFEEALAATDALRRELARVREPADARSLEVRNEVVAATAHVALDQEDAARECFRRALAAEPALDLDPAATPPKVLRVFRAVRAEPRDPR
jgi:hypothetical protein